MIVFPAIDLMNGVCVRLRRGRADDETVFSSDPVATARHWQEQGGRWLHVVDLDGAFSGQPVNAPLIRSICDALDIPVQLGGGIRDAATAKAYLEAGVERLIIGTITSIPTTLVLCTQLCPKQHSHKPNFSQIGVAS